MLMLIGSLSVQAVFFLFLLFLPTISIGTFTGYFTKESTCTQCGIGVSAFHYGTCVLSNYEMMKCFGLDQNPILAFEHNMNSLFIGSAHSHMGNALLPTWLGRDNQSIGQKFATSACN